MTDSPAISRSMEKLLAGEMWPGERVIWCQQPSPMALVRKSLKTVLFGVPFLGFALFWTWRVSASGNGSQNQAAGLPPWFPLAWGSMFIAIGAAMLLSPVWAYWKALRTIYAVTDQRAIIVTATWSRVIFSFVDQQLIQFHRVENDQGNGDIIFHREARSRRRGDYYYDIGFLGIKRVLEAEHRLREVYGTRKTI